MKKVKFIINPKSGLKQNPKQIERLIYDTLFGADISFDLSYTQKPGEATELAKEAVRQNYHLVAVVGGDGTINEAGCGLIESDTA
jgi:diacylglycerol kinase family enzyme